MKQIKLKLILSLVACMCFVLALPCSVWAEGNHYGWDNYPGEDTTASGGVVVGGVTIPFDIPILATDWTRTVDPVTGIPYYSWSINGYDIMSGSTVVATIDSMNLVVDFDPYVRLNFAVSAGAADTTFMLNSTLVSFPTIGNPLAYASAGMTITGNGDGAWADGIYSTDKNYQAVYNGSTVFGNLVNSFSVELENTATSSERKPGTSGTWETIPGGVSSIQSHFNFVLSAGDSASGTSRFELMIPEPATIGLLGLGALSLLRKRRA